MTALWILMAISLGAFRLIKLNPGQLIAISLYFSYLVLRRAIDFVISKWDHSPKQQKAEMPQHVIDISSSYRLKPMEVVLGFYRKKPIRVDLYNHHTLIAGVTGFGKTYLLISILIQLFSKPGFLDFCDVYLFDYKADGDDFLFLWKPLLKGYYSIAENSPEEAIAEIRRLANSIHDKPSKRILVVIDEVASLVSGGKKAEADHALMLLASKLRSRGTIIAATQHPHYQIIPRAVTINMARKIAVHLDDRDQAKLVFRTQVPDDMIPEEPGEFTLKEPGRKGLITGKGIEPRVPFEIHKAVGTSVPRHSDRPEVQFLMDTIAGLSPGDSILGINKRVALAKEVGDDLKQAEVQTLYQMYQDAGLFERERQGQPYRLTLEYSEAIHKLEDYLDHDTKGRFLGTGN